jgi:hypothetical protein
MAAPVGSFSHSWHPVTESTSLWSCPNVQSTTLDSFQRESFKFHQGTASLIPKHHKFKRLHKSPRKSLHPLPPVSTSDRCSMPVGRSPGSSQRSWLEAATGKCMYRSKCRRDYSSFPKVCKSSSVQYSIGSFVRYPHRIRMEPYCQRKSRHFRAKHRRRKGCHRGVSWCRRVRGHRGL